MTSVQVDLLTDQGNGAVVRLPERRSPGVLIQGDTLSILTALAADALHAFSVNDRPEAQALVRDLAAQLSELKKRYEEALKRHGLPLPY